MNFSHNEKVHMAYELGTSNKNCLLATSLAKEYLKIQWRGLILLLTLIVRKRKNKDSFKRRKFNVVLRVTVEPYTSVHTVLVQFDVSKSYVNKIIQKTLNAAVPCSVSSLNSKMMFVREDYSFTCALKEKINKLVEFFDFISFCDEASFH